MTISFSLLSELRKGRSDWAVKVRVARKWEIKADNKFHLQPSLELVVIDSEGSRIQVTISSPYMKKFDSKIKEYHSYAFSNLCVVDNRGNFKITAHQYKLLIMGTNDIGKISGENIPVDKVFNIKSFPEVHAIKDAASSVLIDVIGRVVGKGSLRSHWYNKAKGGKFVEVELEDTSKNKLTCTLWEGYAEKILSHIETAGDAPLIVLLQMFKPKSYQGKVSLANAYFGSEIHIQSWIPEFEEYKRFFADDSSSSQKISELSTNTNVLSFDDFESGNIDVKTVADLKTFVQEGYYWIVSQISEVYGDSWNFVGCFRCKKKLEPHAMGYKCVQCDRIETTPTLRYKVRVTIISGNENATFVLWDDACDILIRKKAMELKEQYVQKSKGEMSKEYKSYCPTEIMSLVGKNAFFKVKVQEKNLSGQDQYYSVGTVIEDKEVVDKYLKTSLVVNKKDDFLAALKESGEEVIEGSAFAELIIKTKLIIWDEAPMVHRHCFEALDRTLRDIMRFDNPESLNQPFGGKTIVIGGDFRQILPVIPKGTREDIVMSTINSSHLWSHCTVLKLTKNMRLKAIENDPTGLELKNFSEWILSIGDGTYGGDNDGVAIIKVPNDLLVNSSGDLVKDIVDSTYPSFTNHFDDVDYLQGRAILAPTLEDVEQINEYMVSYNQSDCKTYLSSDSICRSENSSSFSDQLHSTEFLNTIKSSGLPNHQLSLKVGVPVMLLRNIDRSSGLCNGTRLIITRLGQHIVEAKILNGSNVGEKVYVPRMSLTPSDLHLPFNFQRRQFPLVVSYAMTINKSQGQSLTHVGLFLRRPVFSHGQLYVALSRVTTRAGLKILVCDEEGKTVDETTNVVYKEVFQNL